METKNKIILLADDDQDDRSIFAEALELIDPAMVFFSSENGCEALKRLATRGFRPDVIFMDINMPVMDGVECLRNIMQSDRYKSIPVIMLTTSGLEETKQECLKLGAAGYIQKPDSIKKMTEAIRNALEILP